MSSSPSKKRQRFQYSLRTLLMLMLVTSLGLSGLAVLRERARREARLSATRNAFRSVFISLSNYDESYGHLPCAVRRETVGRETETGMPNGTGRPLYSWRGEISRFLCWGCIVEDLSQPWDSPINKDVRIGPYCYDALDHKRGQVSSETNMLAICGPGTAFGCDGRPPQSMKSLGRNTILIAEVRRSGIHWMEPGDFDIRDMLHTINAADGRGISSRYPGGFHVVFSDGEVWFLSEKIPFETLARFFTIAEANNCDREAVLGEFVLWRL